MATARHYIRDLVYGAKAGVPAPASLKLLSSPYWLGFSTVLQATATLHAWLVADASVDAITIGTALAARQLLHDARQLEAAPEREREVRPLQEGGDVDVRRVRGEGRGKDA